QRQVSRIDESADKAKISWHDVGIVSYKDALDVQFDTTLTMGVEQIKRAGARDKGECGVFVSTLGAEVDGQCRFIKLPGNTAIEICVARRRNLRSWLRPECCPVRHFGRFGTRLFNDCDRNRNVA